jgi:exopolysaccharide biosynthesis polyprenyl glycosylphosphotransferase
LNTFARAESLAATTALQASLPHIDARTVKLLHERRTGALPINRGWLVRRALLFADVVGLSLAFVAATFLFQPVAADHVSSYAELAFFAALLPGWVFLAKLYGLYERDEERTDHSTVDDVVGVFHLVTVGIWLFFLAVLATDLATPPIERLVTFWFLAVALVTTGRAVARSRCRRSVAYLQNTIIVGAGDVGQLTARKLLAHPEYGINLVGFVDTRPKERREDLGHLTLLGGQEDLRELIDMLDVERVIIAFSNESDEETVELIRTLQELGVQIDIVPRLFEILGKNVGIHTVEGIPLVGLPPLRLARSSRFLKRMVDLVVATIGLVLLGPVLLAIALAIKLDSRGPILFRQIRRGGGERIFEIFKFRTMVADAEGLKDEVAHLNMNLRPGGDPRMFKIPDDPRVTRVGGILRRTRLDELPQLLTVVRGEMSLVGPRPIILDEDQYVNGWARKRLDLKPGMTGLWQVLGASDIPFDEMTKLDYLYVTNWSLAEDLRLIVLTLPSIFRRRFAY